MASARTAVLAATVIAVALALAAGWLYFALRHAQQAGRQLAAAQAALKQDMQQLRERSAAQAAQAAQKDKRIEALQSENGALQDKLDRQDVLQMQLQGLRGQNAALAEKLAAAETKAQTASGQTRRAELARIKTAFEQAQSVVARLTGARGIYTVQNGDSLSKIAAFFYHHASRWPDILRANSHLIDKPDLIYPKQVLIIPK